jgi:hypothetical protein
MLADDGGAPGLIGACYTIDSMLLSTLQSFFTNSTYIDEMLTFLTIRSYQNLQTLNLTIKPLVDDPASSRFPPNTPLFRVARDMFVEQWHVSVSFNRYYRSCSPSACRYTKTARRNGFFGVLLTFISMIGGLSVALRAMTPLLINLILDFFKSRTKKKKSDNVKLLLRVKKILQSLWKIVINLNLFPARVFDSRMERSTAKHLGQWSTRLYIVILATALITLTFRTVVSPKLFTKTYANPSLDAYNNLVNDHATTLQCPCSLSSFPYSRFLQIEARFHPVSKKSLPSFLVTRLVSIDLFKHLHLRRVQIRSSLKSDR